MNIASTSHDILIRGLLNSPTTTDASGIKTIWFDQPYHLYLEETQARTYLDMISRDTFVSALHGPAEQLIWKYRKEFLRGLHEPIEFYDLGPGMPKKTIPLLNELKAEGKDFIYRPVDISKKFLEITKQEVAKIGIKSNELNCLFEDLPNVILEHDNGSRLFLIGLTFNNYRPERILSLLHDMSGPNDINIIITQFFTNRKKDIILTPYRDEYAERFNYLPLQLAGFPTNHLCYFAEFRSQRIEMGFSLLDDVVVEGMWFEKGTRIVTAISYRFRKKDLISEISDYFDHCEIFQDRNQKDASLVAFKLHKYAI